MSVLRPRPPADPVVLIEPPGVAPPAAARTGPADRGGPLASILDQPARLLADYRMERPASELYCMLQTARRIRDRSDRVIVVAAAGEAAAARTILETCCHPFHGDLPRAERGGRPRLFFTGASFANDRDQGLLDLIAPAGRPPGGDLLDRWALVVAAGDVITASVAACARLYLDVLGAETCSAAAAVDRVAVVGAALAPLAVALGLPAPYPVPAVCAGAAGVFTAVALLPAAIAGVDVVRLLEGAVAMNMRFAEAPWADNPVCRLLARPPGTSPPRRRLVAVDERLATLAAWFECLQEAIPVDGGREEPLLLAVDEPRRDPLVVPPPAPWLTGGDGLPLDACVGASWTDLDRGARVPGSGPEIRLPRVDEHAIGQLLQMLLLTTRGVAPRAAAGPAPPAEPV